MMKKIIYILGVSIFLLTSSVLASGAGIRQVTNTDNLDQYQYEKEDGHGCYEGHCILAQSFRPSYSQLTRVKLFLCRIGYPSDVTFSIQNSKDSGVISSITIPSEELPDMTIGESREHFFVFPEPVKLDIGQQYFFVLDVPNTDDVNSIIIYGASYWEGDHWDLSDHYSLGKGWFYKSTQGEWESVADWAFETYGTGQENQKPTTPTIQGPNKIEEADYIDFTFSSTDPEGSPLEYYIDWGDGTNSGWVGPYESGEEIVKYHWWKKQDNIELKAMTRDLFGKESDWGVHEITMPRVKINSLFSNQLIQRFPLISRLIQLMK